jgi:hypothetical protein
VTGDIRKQLIEALDEAERQAHEARGRIVGGNWDVSRHHRRLAQVVERGALIAENLPDEIAEHIARWDPSTVLRLIERDRRLLGETLGQLADDAADETARWHLDQLAALWLGSSEVTDGR